MRHGMRVLVLGHELDPTVNAVAHALAERHGASAVHHLDLARLAHARWQHRVESDGKVATRLHLGGRDDAVFDVVFDRSEPLAALPFRGWSDAERTYGRSEWLALLLGWLRSLGDRVVNRPSLGCLNGPADRAWPWLARAAAAGLVPHPCGATTSARRLPPPDGALEHPTLRPEASDDAPAGEPRVFAYATPAAAIVDAIVVGDEVFADVAATARESCLRLAHGAGTDVLAIRLAADARRPDVALRRRGPGAGARCRRSAGGTGPSARATWRRAVILFAGIPTEAPLALALAAAERARIAHRVLDLREAALFDLQIEWGTNGFDGTIALGDASLPLRSVTGIFARMHASAQPPERRLTVRDAPGHEARAHSRSLCALFEALLDVWPATVVNRPQAIAAHASKPAQAQAVCAAGLRTPATIVTNVPDAAREFHAEHGRIVHKSASALRSIVSEWTPEERPADERGRAAADAVPGARRRRSTCASTSSARARSRPRSFRSRSAPNTTRAAGRRRRCGRPISPTTSPPRASR